MKEAIGGSYIFEIVIVFIILFTSFIVYSVSYTRAFKVKNAVLDLIEQHQGFTTLGVTQSIEGLSVSELENDNSVEALAYLFIKESGYKHNILDGNDDLCYLTSEYRNSSSGDNLKGKMYPGGYCVYKKCNNERTRNRNTTYIVTAFIALKIPVFNMIVRVPVSGETKTIYTDASNIECSSGTVGSESEG